MIPEQISPRPPGGRGKRQESIALTVSERQQKKILGNFNSQDVVLRPIESNDGLIRERECPWLPKVEDTYSKR